MRKKVLKVDMSLGEEAINDLRGGNYTKVILNNWDFVSAETRSFFTKVIFQPMVVASGGKVIKGKMYHE